ncbi:MAG TPA: VanZ family protein [Candidatus Acidoferrum sp.]|nr:VanZ family protein [Candidatus Acidoferrum sp.]
MLPYMLAAVPATALLRALRARHIDTNLRHEALFCLFVSYLAGLARVTVIPDEWPTPFFALRGTQSFIPGRIFFDTWREVRGGNWDYLTIALIGNILIFVPLGLLVCLLWRGASLKRAALSGLAVSLVIELCQLPLDRWTDIDDLWLNALGAALGYGVYVLMRRPEWGFTGTASCGRGGRTPYRG